MKPFTIQSEQEVVALLKAADRLAHSKHRAPARAASDSDWAAPLFSRADVRSLARPPSWGSPLRAAYCRNLVWISGKVCPTQGSSSGCAAYFSRQYCVIASKARQEQ